jgi:hypothetical protein
MNSSVKSFVPNVSDFPGEPGVVADVIDAAGLDELELELLLPHAVRSSAATVASTPAASVRLNRCETGLDDRPPWCERSHPHPPRPVDKPDPIVDRINGSYSLAPNRGGYWLHWRELRIGHDRTREGLVDAVDARCGPFERGRRASTGRHVAIDLRPPDAVFPCHHSDAGAGWGGCLADRHREPA